jgi:hypothetical protein
MEASLPVEQVITNLQIYGENKWNWEDPGLLPTPGILFKKKTNLQIVFNDCGKNEMRITPSWWNMTGPNDQCFWPLNIGHKDKKYYELASHEI